MNFCIHIYQLERKNASRNMNLDSHLPSICVLRLPAKRRQQLPPAVDAIVHYVEEIG